MFDDLDDDRPFEVTPAFREAVGRRAKARRRRSRVLATGAAVLVVALVGVGAAAVAVARRDAAIDRVHLTTDPSVDGAVNVLVLGSDPLHRADTSVLVRFTPEGDVRVLTIPRDLKVRGQRIGGSTRLTEFLTEGVDAYVDALQGTLRLPVDHVVELDFDGFRELVDAVGGLRVEVLTELRDPQVGLDLLPACHHLDGDGALQLVRARHVLGDPTGDVGRAGRAQALVLVALQQLADLDPGLRDADRLSQVLADHAVVDAGLDLRTMADLGRRLLTAGPNHTTTASLPVGAAVDPATGGAVVVRVGGDDLLRAFGAVDLPRAERIDGYPGTDEIPTIVPPADQLRPCP